MIYVSAMTEVVGKWVTDEVQILAEPYQVGDQWHALANAFGMLAIVELKVSVGKGESRNG